MNFHKPLFAAILLPAFLFSHGFANADDGWKLDGKTREKCLAVVREGLKAEDFWPAMHAAEAATLAGLGEEVTNFLTPLLETEKDDQKRCGLARELTRAGDRGKATVMMDILRGNDPHGFVHAAESLYKVGFDGESIPLKVHFRMTSDIRLKLMAAAALAKHESGPFQAEAFAFLRKVLAEESDPEVFRLPAWVLGRIGDETDIPRIKARLSDAKDDALVHAFLNHSLAALGDKEGRKVTLANLKSEDPAIRTYASVFAGESGIKEAAPLLTGLLDDEDLDARIRAAQGLIALSQ